MKREQDFLCVCTVITALLYITDQSNAENLFYLNKKTRKKTHPAYYVDDGISRMGVHLLNITNHNCKIIINLQLWNSYRKTFTKTTA